MFIFAVIIYPSPLQKGFGGEKSKVSDGESYINYCSFFIIYICLFSNKKLLKLIYHIYVHGQARVKILLIKTCVSGWWFLDIYKRKLISSVISLKEKEESKNSAIR